ncbi:MAG: CaiB/BaiF CoA transferase family protein [Candidatus Acidiferrales bacterium]
MDIRTGREKPAHTEPQAVRGSSGPPLMGIKVLEVGHGLASPFCTMQLADMGADVVKIEEPGTGDFTRLAAPFIDGESSGFVRLNRNKRSVALNLKAPEGREIFLRLAQDADIVSENMRPGTMAHLGLDYARLAESNPRLIYVAASGWGQTGPYASLAGLDIMAQAMSGLMSITGEEGRPPVKVGVPICDLVCGLYGALAAVSALQARERTGRGQYIDVSLFEVGVSLSVWEAARYFANGEIPKPLGSAHQATAPYQAIRGSDGYFTIGATSSRNWTAFCRAMGLEHLTRDPRFATVDVRHRNRAELIPIIENITQTQPAAHWIALLQENGVPCAVIQDYSQVYSDPGLIERDYFADLPHPTLGKVRVLGNPMRFSDTPVQMVTAGPLLGQHSVEVLTELGMSDSDVDRLVREGVVVNP